jgi:hypothetical protein
MNRRDFVKDLVVVSAAGAVAAGAVRAAEPAKAPPAAAKPGAAAAMPMGKIGSLNVSRLLLGGNLLTHFTHSRDLKYVYNLARAYNTQEKIIQTMQLAEANGINTLAIHTVPAIIDLLKRYRKEKMGKMQFIICSTARIAPGLSDYTRSVNELAEWGCDAMYLWGVQGDDLAKANKPDLIADVVKLIKAAGVPAGVGGHQLAVPQLCEKADVGADFYIKTFHHHKYPSANLNHDSSWCAEPEDTARFMAGVKKPWIAFKVMAAGAIAPQDAFRYAFENGADHVLAGMFDFEVAEDAKTACQTVASVKRARPWQS